jgi:hypothetical protein
LCCTKYYLACISSTSIVIITLNGSARANASCGVAKLRIARVAGARIVSKQTFGCTAYILTTISGTGVSIITQHRVTFTDSISFITSLRVAHIRVVTHFSSVVTSGLSITSSVANIICARVVVITIYSSNLTYIIHTLFRETSVCPSARIG